MSSTSRACFEVVLSGGRRLRVPPRFDVSGLRRAAILTRHGLDELTIETESAPPGETSTATMMARGGRFVPFTMPSSGARAHAGGYAAHFVEVHVDPDL